MSRSLLLLVALVVGTFLSCDAHYSNHQMGIGASGGRCVEGSTWKEDCNYCSCIDGGAACSRMDCRFLQEGGRCVEGSTWKEECNYCSCIDGGAACSRMDCRFLQEGNFQKSRQEPHPWGTPMRPHHNIYRPWNHYDRCVEGTTWKQDCNTCRCSNGMELCTKMGCHGLPPYSPGCVEGTTWKHDCNTCRCSNGMELCTKMDCHGLPPYSPGCVEGTMWKQDCNTCRCSNGMELCTKMGCHGLPPYSPVTGPYHVPGYGGRDPWFGLDLPEYIAGGPANLGPYKNETAAQLRRRLILNGK